MIGERGQPWRVPFVIENGLDNISDVYTCAEGEEYKAIMADNMGPEKGAEKAFESTQLCGLC